MAKKYGVVSTKGGVGKTSICANLGGILADMGQRVLLVDGDFQQNLSSYYEIEHQAPQGLKALITRADPTDCISSTRIDNLDIVLSDDPHQKLLLWFRESSNNVYYLAAALKKLDDDYDYILIDSQGARGILQEAIILASDALLSPIIPDVADAAEPGAAAGYRRPNGQGAAPLRGLKSNGTKSYSKLAPQPQCPIGFVQSSSAKWCSTL